MLRRLRVTEKQPVHRRVPAAGFDEEAHPRRPGSKPRDDDEYAGERRGHGEYHSTSQNLIDGSQLSWPHQSERYHNRSHPTYKQGCEYGLRLAASVISLALPRKRSEAPSICEQNRKSPHFTAVKGETLRAKCSISRHSAP